MSARERITELLRLRVPPGRLVYEEDAYRSKVEAIIDYLEEVSPAKPAQNQRLASRADATSARFDEEKPPTPAASRHEPESNE